MESSLQQTHLIQALRSQSTWRLLGLGLVTYGVYFAHYVAKQTRVLNAELAPEQHIPRQVVLWTFFLQYLSLALFFGYLFVEESHPIATLSNVIDRLSFIPLLIWGFMARNRVNSACGISRTEVAWFHGLWTFLFSPLYFNYKINVLSDKAEDPSAVVL